MADIKNKNCKFNAYGKIVSDILNHENICLWK